MRPAEVALQVLPGELSALDAVPPAIVAALLAGYFVIRWNRQRTDARKVQAETRDQADKSTWQRMTELNERLVRQRDDAVEQIDRRDELIRQQAAHIGDLEQRNDELQRDLREALRHVDHREDSS